MMSKVKEVLESDVYRQWHRWWLINMKLGCIMGGTVFACILPLMAYAGNPDAINKILLVVSAIVLSGIVYVLIFSVGFWMNVRMIRRGE